MKTDRYLQEQYPDLLDSCSDPSLVRLIGDLDALYTGVDLPLHLQGTSVRPVRQHLVPRSRQTEHGRGAALLQWLPRRIGTLAATLLAIVVLAGVGVAVAEQGGLLWQLIAGSPPPVVPKDLMPPDKRTVQPSYNELRPEEAEREAGFRIRLPSLLPDGIDPNDVTVTVSRLVDKGTPLVRVAYWKVEQRDNGQSRSWSRTVMIDLQQLPVRDEPWFRPKNWVMPNGEPMKAVCQEETIALRPGVDAIRFTCTLAGTFLTWTDGGIEFRLRQAGLTPEQAIAIARSIR